MPDSDELINFKELVSAVKGEGLQELTRHIGQRLGLSPAWSGRGPDGGRDLLFTELTNGPISKDKITWLVNCKDFIDSGKSANETDMPDILDKVQQHHANGYLFVTTTTVSSAAKAKLDSQDIRNGGTIHTCVWDSSELNRILLAPDNRDLLMQFIPESYKRVQGLTSLEGAILSFCSNTPADVLASVKTMLSPFYVDNLRGEVICSAPLRLDT